MQDLGRILLLTGLILALAGGLLYLGSKLGLGRLPGDFVIQKGALRIYIPLATCVLLSVVISILLRLFRK